MNNYTISERPGVFTHYDVTSLYSAASGRSAAGLVAKAAKIPAGQPVKCSRLSEVIEAFGTDTDGVFLCTLASLLFQNGVPAVLIAAPENTTAAGYKAALALLDKYSDIGVILTDSTEQEVLKAAAAAADRCSAARCERLCAIAADQETLEQMALNNERVLCCSQPSVADGVTSPLFTAAAVAGVIASAADPSAPLSGTVLSGIALDSELTDDEVNRLVSAGITTAETQNGRCEIIRAVTTRTKTNGVADRTFLDVNTIMVIDYVMVSIRNTLKARMSGLKNSGVTRTAIATQTGLELLRCKDAGIIEDYQPPLAAADPADPTVCLIEVEFKIVSGLNQIHIAAHIKV